MPIHSAPFRRARRSGFSLIEVLMAIFILGIGVISIAALFPAGIAQQRRSSDDVLGSVVANNALEVLRSKLLPEDFGTFEEYGVNAPRPTIEGDWTWLRPGFIFPDADPALFPNGAIDVFNGTALAVANEGAAGVTGPVSGMPFNTAKYGTEPPSIIFHQEERAYPQQLVTGAANRPRPEYVWDCMFRRFQGRVYVAIFVYRVGSASGEVAPFRITQTNGDVPPLPVWLDLTVGGRPWWTPWDVVGFDPVDPSDDAFIPRTDAGTDFDLNFEPDAWQLPGQLIVDQNNNIHRVLSGRESMDDGPVELVQPLPAMPALPVYWLGNGGVIGIDDVVTDIWFLPRTHGEFRITPVYVGVSEL